MLKKILMIAILATGATAFAEDKIAVINTDKVRMETKAGKSVIEQLGNLQTKYKNKFEKLQQSFENEKQELDKQKSVLSKEAYAKREAEFNNKLQESRKDIQAEAAKFDKTQQNAWDELSKVANDVIGDIAKDNKYALIFPSAGLVYMDAKIDITSQVIAAMDKKIDTIAVKE